MTYMLLPLKLGIGKFDTQCHLIAKQSPQHTTRQAARLILLTFLPHSGIDITNRNTTHQQHTPQHPTQNA